MAVINNTLKPQGAGLVPLGAGLLPNYNLQIPGSTQTTTGSAGTTQGTNTLVGPSSQPTAGFTPAKTTTNNYGGGSIVDYLNSTGQASDFNTRTQLAGTKGIQNYTGTAEQNTQLLNLLRGGGGTTTNASGTANVGGAATQNQQQIQQQLNTSLTQLSDLQAKQSAMQQYGLTDQSQVLKNANGQYVPVQAQTQDVVPPPQGNTNPYTSMAPTFAGLVGGIANTAAQPSQQYVDAQKQYLDYQNKIAALQSSYAQSTANLDSEPIDLALASGQQGILSRLEAGKEAALSGQLAGAQAAAQTATGQQATQLGGLESAAGLVAPQQVSPTNVPYNPATGTYGTPASTAYGTGTNGLQAVGNIAGQINVGQNVTQLNSYLGGAQVVGNNLNQLIKDADINPTGITYLNGVIQFGADKMSNPQYREFAGQINDFVASLAPILGVGGNVTDMKTQMSNQIINGLQSGETITQVVDYFLKQAQQKIQGMSAGGGAGGTQTQTSTGGQAGTPQSSLQVGGFNYKQNADGSWSLVK